MNSINGHIVRRGYRRHIFICSLQNGEITNGALIWKYVKINETSITYLLCMSMINVGSLAHNLKYAKAPDVTKYFTRFSL